jgi:23S rRNA (pseudouridine1915-N3)-methyltransferase
VYPPIEIVAVGRLKEAYLKDGVADYLKRLQPYARVTLTEVADERIAPSKTEAHIRSKETERVLAAASGAQSLIILSERGKTYTSEGFAHAWAERLTGNQPNRRRFQGGTGPIIIGIGGPLGWDPALIDAADWVVSLSPMTFPHPMVRLVLLEQLYRMFKILRNEPYHK